MKQTLKSAFFATIPVLTGYLVLGFGFGIILKSNGYGLLMAFAMSLLIYAGSMQYVAIDLLTGGAGLLTAALTTLTVNLRHLFYGISMVDKYRGIKGKPFLMFTLTDETYSLVCAENGENDKKVRERYYFLVSALNYFYWVSGSVVGSLLGAHLPFSTEGIDFSLTALFLTVFTEQWLTTKKHQPAILGVLISVLCLLLFGKEHFLIFAMLLITLSLAMLYKKEGKRYE
jgi:4-azaleucine resistance transporter AzlC